MVTKNYEYPRKGIFVCYDGRMEVVAASKGRRGKCAACNDSPVPHLPTYISASIEAWLADHSVSRFASNTLFFSLRSALADVVLGAFIEGALFLRIASLGHDIDMACTYRSQVVWEEARCRGIKMEQIFLFNKPTEIYRARLRDMRIYFQSLPVPDSLVDQQYERLDDKLCLKKFLNEQGIAVSRAHQAHTLREARDIFESLQKPLVVKPRIGTRARHTTTNIRTIDDLEKAYTLAHQLCAYVLIEEHFTGAVSRATVVEGVLRGFLEQLPARITGDGTSTITELIEAKNASRPERVAVISLDAEHLAYLNRSGYTTESVPPRGETLDLSRRTGRFEGGATREIRDTVHPKLRAYVEKAARVLKTPLVGFDLIIPDPLQDPDEQRWGFLEANSLPYIDLHYFPLEGEPSNVAAAVWDLWNKREV